MNKKNREHIFESWQQENPDPRTELQYQSGYELLVAVVLSAQATDISVNKATDRLYLVANTPQKMIDLGQDALQDYIKSIGLFRSKAKHIIQLSHIIIEKFDGEIPSNREDLMLLPGVGRKTANVVLNEFFNQPTIAVDTHIFRVANRTGIAKGSTPDKVEIGLLKKVPKQFRLNAHHWMILHGRYTCIARRPKCNDCKISQWCDYVRS